MTSSMRSLPAVLAVALLLAGCGGPGSSGKDNPFQPDPAPKEDPDPEPDNTSFTEDTDGDGVPNALEQDGDQDANGIENVLQGSLRAVALSADGSSVDVEISGLDGTPVNARYRRNTDLDITGALLNEVMALGPGEQYDPDRVFYQAYSLQEDPLDRLFTALGRGSADGTTRGDLVHGHGQFNIFIEGALYTRDGAFDRPEIGSGPGQGQVSYDGVYVGYSNLGSATGQTLLPVSDDPAILPQEDARVVGQIFVNANFVDDEVNGSIFRRVIIDPDVSDGGSTRNRNLPNIALTLTDIDDNGQFFGTAEISRRQTDPAFDGLGDDGTVVGNYGGIFGGEDAETVSGITRFEGLDIDPSRSGSEIEHGIFVLTQCGRDGDESRCDAVSP